MEISNSNKLYALLWKNSILQWNDLWGLFKSNILTLILLFIIAVFPMILPSEPKPNEIYTEALEIDNLDLFKKIPSAPDPENIVELHLAYSPDTSTVFQEIVKEAATNLKLEYSGYPNAKALANILRQKNYLAGVEFDDSLASITKYPEKLSYKLRFPDRLRKHDSDWYTDRHYLESGDADREGIDGGSPVGYLREGFVPVQHAISTAFIMQAAQAKPTLPKIVMQRYPKAGTPIFVMELVIHYLLARILVICFLSMSQHVMRTIMEEKEKQLKEILKIIGLQSWLQWLAWFVCGLIMMCVCIILIAATLMIPWGRKAYISYASITFILFFFLVYAMANLTLMFLETTFFSKSTIAVVVMSVFFLVTMVPYYYAYSIMAKVSLPLQILICLLPNTAFSAGIRTILIKERSEEGWHWSNMFAKASADDPLSLGVIIVMMLLSCVLYMTLCLYFEQILPGEFGVPRKWNFPFKKSFWTGKQKHEKFSRTIKRTQPDAFEAEPLNRRMGVQVISLSKKFGEHLAVDNVSINMYESEVTVLLGHNGAGKTTLIAMITGMTSSTSGTVIVNGYDIRENLTGARMSMSICPQQNILFDDLTVKQHLIFYGRLKGLKGNALQIEVKRYIKKTNLEKKTNTKTSKLSGGMKRKLSVCAALCGGSKVVLFDEPSSGLDTSARRQLWDLILSEKQGRTILLTTHFMDEAEALADRIAIMSGGQLQCYGTPFFLKKRFGCGYILICMKKSNCNSADVTKLLNKYIPGIEPATDIGSELSYRLGDADTHKFKQMFHDLESNSERLNLEGFGISVTSIEDVFMKVGSANQGKGDPINLNNLLLDKNDRLNGRDLYYNHWRAMLLKKYLHRIRHKFFFVAQILLPIFIGIVIWLLTKSKLVASGGAQPALPLDLLQFPATVTVLETRPNVKDGSLEEKISDNYKKLVKSLGSGHTLKETGNTDFIAYMLDFGQLYQKLIDKTFIAAATVDDGKITAWLNNEPLHTAPITLNLVHNAIARSTIGSSASINVVNHPLPPIQTEKGQKTDVKVDASQIASLLILACSAFVGPMYVFLLIEERISGVKFLQFISGVRVTTFWFSHFVYDFCTFSITYLILLIGMAINQIKGFSTFGEIGRMMIVLILSNFSLIPCIYLASEFGNTPSTGYTLALGALIFPVIACTIVESLISNTATYLLNLIPLYTLGDAIANLQTNTEIRELCRILQEENGPAVQCETTPYFAWKEPGILCDILFFFASGILFFSLIFLKESNFISNMCDRISQREPPQRALDDYFDEDVELEKEKVDDLISLGITRERLVLDRLTKYYRRYLAVNQISLIVRESECFGLLGVNGAGKTSTFKMLIGEERISWGDGYVNGISLKENMSDVHDEIGYCPQFDALLGYLTGREMLKMYCLIRGIPKQRISPMCTELAVGLGFMRYYNKKVRSYSGGNKRKLSVAIAVIANPTLIYLDEPTSGMDPGARRNMWNILCKFRDSGKSLVLTSHSMDECEALCTRLAIMVNGEFRCLGSIQHLKKKFTKGFTLKIKILQEDNVARKSINKKLNKRQSVAGEVMKQDIERVIEFVEYEFPDAQLKDKLEGLLTFEVPLTRITWSQIFGIMEASKEGLNIEDYSITQTTLEDIFMKMAQMQTISRRN